MWVGPWLGWELSIISRSKTVDPYDEGGAMKMRMKIKIIMFILVLGCLSPEDEDQDNHADYLIFGLQVVWAGPSPSP